MLTAWLIPVALTLPPPPAEGVGPVAALEACRAVTDDAARLGCFDRTARALFDARAAKQVVVMDRAEVQRTKRGLFGFSLPDLNPFGDGDEGNRELVGTIRSAAPFGYGYYSLRLDDGSEWQTGDRVANFVPRAGDAIKIKRGALGYRATSRGALVQVRRVR